MTRPRKALISHLNTPYYHITSRCVRRAFLCGTDAWSGQCYEHRRQWIVDRIRLLSSLFAIDICAYAVMNNHYHLVLKLCPEQFDELDDHAIRGRWLSLFKGPALVQRHHAGEALTAAERAAVSDITSVWREKLMSISWFMRCLNQHIACNANREDNCTGKFWECRFKSQALKTDEALLSCMAYVDLNPIRAAIADTPEKSEYTSIQERIQPTFDLDAAISEQTDRGEIFGFDTPLKPLLHFDEAVTSAPQTGIPVSFSAYLQLVDWTGRMIRHDKRGAIENNLSPILERLTLSPTQWLANATQFEAIHHRRFNKRAKCAKLG